MIRAVFQALFRGVSNRPMLNVVFRLILQIGWFQNYSIEPQIISMATFTRIIFASCVIDFFIFLSANPLKSPQSNFLFCSFLSEQNSEGKIVHNVKELCTAQNKRTGQSQNCTSYSHNSMFTS